MDTRRPARLCLYQKKSGIFFIRILLGPAKLRPAENGKTKQELRRSLGTKSLTVARIRMDGSTSATAATDTPSLRHCSRTSALNCAVCTRRASCRELGCIGVRHRIGGRHLHGPITRCWRRSGPALIRRRGGGFARDAGAVSTGPGSASTMLSDGRREHRCRS